jgi:UDP-GlcNAc:undecaprenyl-phosphate GlcNAc-1-phosphate transferase
MENIYILTASLLLGLILTPLAIKAAFKFGVLDRPVTHLKKHEHPVPYLGGAAIFAAFIIPVVTAKLILNQTPHGVIGIIAGAAIITILGLIDDIRPMGPAVKLFVELLVAGIMIKAGIHIKFIANPFVNNVLTILWIVGITNSMNLLDIMDGLAGGVAAVASLAFFFVAMFAGRINDMIPAIALFGAIVGFLFYNSPPAKIYMGDAGSLFLGFMLSALALNESYSKVNLMAVLSPVLILGVPIFDTMLVSLIRIKRGMLPIYGSNDHSSQRLVMMGLSKPQAVLTLVTATAALSAIAILSTFLSSGAAILLYLGTAVAAVVAAFFIGTVDMTDYHKVHRKKAK